jgi:hypothetical protein
VQHPRALMAGLGTATALLGACAPAGEVREDRGQPVYEGVTTLLLDPGLVRVTVTMRDGNGPSDVEAYARCAVARYALDEDLSFARQVRTIVTKGDGTKDEKRQAGQKAGQNWIGDAVFLVAATRPEGLQVIDAKATVEDCARLGIPTV